MGKVLFIAAVLFAAWYYLRKPEVTRTIPESEARDILGVGPNASPEEIRAAHRRLVSAVHPDKGGSAGLTRRINAARDTLLRR